MFTYDCLEKAWNEANKKSEREHITSFITNNPNLFKIGTYEPLRGLYHHRWVVDHPKDYEFAKAYMRKSNNPVMDLGGKILQIS